jgi:hypothetical protein
MTNVESRSGFLPMALVATLALVMVWAWLPEMNTPPVGRVTEHAKAHGSDLDNALWELNNGACVRTYRAPNLKRYIDVIGNDGDLFKYGIVRSTVGDVVTGYYAPSVYWAVKVMGWTLVTQTGHCR